MKTVTYDETRWKLVPVKATHEMLEAAFLCTAISVERLERAYRAMLSASPDGQEK